MMEGPIMGRRGIHGIRTGNRAELNMNGVCRKTAHGSRIRLDTGL